MLGRLRGVKPIPAGAAILEVGAAAGETAIALAQLGYRVCGVEPWGDARRNADRLASQLRISIEIANGRAEALPFDAESFDIVLAFSVMEHVTDIDLAFAEAFRVLRPGGVFWFSAASSMSPFQNEIARFSLFGWYPDVVKRRIMVWARRSRPHLIGHTETPAVHWFTPWKANRLLRRHGFVEVYDRWDLRRLDEGGAGYRMGLSIIRSSRLSKLIADVVVPACSYAALKR